MTYEYYATLRRVVDGDTVELDVDLGFGIHSVHSVRLYGINAPEMKTPEGVTAKAFAERWFMDAGPALTITTRKGRETEKFGRYLATIQKADLLPLDTRPTLNFAMVASGNAVVYLP